MTRTGTIKVLHIDDDESFLEFFRNTYEDQFEIVSINGGNDVPEIVSRETPDALVLDYDLPGRNGLELLATIRENHPSLPVIFYTGQGNEEIARQAFREGATDYFVKRTADFAQKEKLVNSIQKAMEKRAVEEELAEKQAMLEGIIDYNPYSIMIADRNGHPIQTNKAHEKLWSVSPGANGKIYFDEDLPIPDEVKEAIQEEWKTKGADYSLFTDENALKDDETAHVTELWKSGESIRFPPIWYSHPLPLIRESMKPKCVGGNGFSIRNSKGEIINYIHMHEDITARVEAEEALRKAHEDLTRTHGELRAAYESVEKKVAERTAELEEANTKLADAIRKLQAEIEERSRLQSELEQQNGELESFSHTVSHDLRNNLLVMQKRMERDEMTPDDREVTQKRLLQNTAHLQQFVERLLLLAQAGKVISRKQMVSLEETAKKAFSMTAASHSNAELVIDSPFPAVFCDPGAFEQILSNLFSNALAHAQPESNPVIKVGCAVNDGTSVITVSDNGKGIEPGIVPKIFGSTFTTNRREHFGLGLAIVKKLVEAHGGEVHAESEGPGKGAAFIMTLPLAGS